MKYTKHISQKNTPQTQEVFGLNQVKNNAGGYVFKVDPFTLLNRFLLLGTEGGTYYVNEAKLTQDNAKGIIELIKTDGKTVVAKTVELVKENRLPKIDPALFVIALAASFGDAETKKTAYEAIKNVTFTSTHLFNLCGMLKELRGWSRGLRTAVSKFYTTKSPTDLAYQLVKYRQRNGWTHRDVLRLTHPSTNDQALKDLFSYTVGKTESYETLPIIIGAYEKASKSTSSSELVELINTAGVTWEMIPTQFLKDKEVLGALLYKMPMTALLRNLNKFTAAGLLDGRTSVNTKHVVSLFTNKEIIRKARLHPITLLNALKTYSAGRGDLGSLTWTPNQAVCDALETAFEQSFAFVKPSGKKLLIAVDVSGSMQTQKISKMSLSPAQASAALLTTMLRVEPNAEVMFFNSRPIEPNIGKRSSYKEIDAAVMVGGSTDLAAPYAYALYKKLNVDAIITFTDNETWAGSSHPFQVFNEYRNIVNKNVKAVVLAMTATEFGLFPQEETNILNAAGFDASLHEVINTFIGGNNE